MSYATETNIAYAGQWGKGSQSTQKAFAAQNVGETNVVRGRFVAFVEGGIQELSAVTDAIAGVVVHTVDKPSYPTDSYLSIGSLPHGDSIWCELEGEAKVGDPVFIRAVGKNGKSSGVVLTAAVEGETVATDYKVIAATATLALVGRLA